MGRRAKSDELGINQRIVDMHDVENMTHREISDALCTEGMDISREAVRRSPDNREYHAWALDAAVAVKKHQKFPYRVADWADGLLHPRKKM